LEKARQLGINIKAIEFGTDHVHVFVINCKNHAPAKIVQQLKGFSSRMMRKHHWNLFRKFLWGKKFWAEGYFCRSIGATTTDAVQYYIEHSQKKHWVEL
jgi:putative transposase